MNSLIVSFFLLLPLSVNAAVIYAHDYNITGIGTRDQIVFSSDFSLDSLTAISTIEIEMSNSYVGEFVLSIRSPSGQQFLLLDRDGERTRVGAGNGLLSGVEIYTLRNPTEVALSVMNWDFSRYQAGGEYGAREWPIGSWNSGVWNLTLFNDNTSAFNDGVIGAVTVTGIAIPEPSCLFLLALGSIPTFILRRRSKGEQAASSNH